MDNDRVSFRTGPMPGLDRLIERAADKQRRDLSEWMRQSLYIVAMAELSGVDVHDLLKRFMKK
jgi:hypothetical protein